MRLYIKDHFSLILFNSLQLFLLFLIYWLQGNEHPWIALYGILLGLFLLALFLVGRYLNNRSFYQHLQKEEADLEETMNVETNSSLTRAFKALLVRQYQLYQGRIEKFYNQQRDYYRFVNQWIHEMKTPLSVIELILQEEEDPRIGDIKVELDRLSKGLETALYVARLEDFRQDFRVERLQLHGVAHHIVQDNKRFFIRHHVYPVIDIPQDLTAASDAKWLPFLIGQLVTNAVKYSGGEDKKVVIKGYRIDSRSVALEVTDQGIGIPKEDRRRVFQPFYTGENGRKYQGSTGMGLYLVKEICRRLNHELELISEVGKGTTIRLIMKDAFDNLTKV
ncbi:signal transduction histidine kinase [Pullulanibacillus pueri]|uniref:histidine kinase n=1 Tax=Pullulanibacillus pueri TaxID=1437324 RepID=A0A8J2ZXF9_9BACL|nr:sensor histidine kinase [Pullulanibacillus pueri]MBM7680676.1 signal transduction histidine kinase [Pullulanibacillus pueri]GGH83770.1 sensor histidine kinase [Pullulanibacillus pueri]